MDFDPAGVTILGARLPISGWTLVALGVGAALSVVVWRRSDNRQSGAVLIALLSLTLAVGLTVTPGADHPALGVAACVPYDWNDLLFNVAHTGGGVVAGLFNMLLMLPLTASLVLATDRVLPAIAVSAVLPVSIELVQTQLPGRSCTVADLLANGTGAILGVGVGWAAVQLGRARRWGME